MKPTKIGYDLLHDHTQNKSTAFTKEERENYRLKGLLPFRISTQKMQTQRVMENINRKAYDIERYVLLSALQERNERLFYRIAIEHIEEIMPLLYTPTVGQACKEFSHIFRQPKGFYINPENKGEIADILNNWPEKDIRVIVVTDGQRILGLGDLGANGMGIPIGKLALYTACAGIQPHQCLPVMLDVGTNNETYLNDPLYLGYPHRRLTGDEYFGLVEEFVMAVQEKYPKALIQFEDFLTPNAHVLLQKYRDRVLSFNDDIQGTAAVALAGVFASGRITKIDFKDLKILFLGAGSAATGIADLIASALQEAGLSKEEAYKRLWFVDSKGLVVSSRSGLAAHKQPFAHEHAPMSLLEAIDDIKPHALIGATGAPGTFTQEVVERMCNLNERPVIFALSNPTDKAECTAEQAYTWSKGKAVFASGSPFAPVTYNGQTFHPGQGNNAYIFPGMGLGIIACEASRVTDEMFMSAARTLAEFVSEKDIENGSLYPPLKDIRKVSLRIAIALVEEAYKAGLAKRERPENLEQVITEYMYDGKY